MFHPELTEVNLWAETADEAIQILSKKLLEHGFVKPSFIKAVLAREMEYPTGLPTNPPVALPHTDPEHCLKSGIAVGVLSQPVTFGEMGRSSAFVDVRVVFVLSVVDPTQQVNVLSKLLDAFQTPIFLQSLVSSKSTVDAYEILVNYLDLNL